MEVHLVSAQAALEAAKAADTSEQDRFDLWNEAALAFSAFAKEETLHQRRRQENNDDDAEEEEGVGAEGRSEDDASKKTQLLQLMAGLDSEVLDFIGWQLVPVLAVLCSHPTAQHLLDHVCTRSSAREILLTFPDAFQAADNDAVPLLLRMLRRVLERLPSKRFGVAQSTFRSLELLMENSWSSLSSVSMHYTYIMEELTRLAEDAPLETQLQRSLWTRHLMYLVQADLDTEGVRRDRQVQMLERCGVNLDSVVAMASSPASREDQDELLQQLPALGLARFVVFKYSCDDRVRLIGDNIDGHAIGEAMLVKADALMNTGELQPALLLLQRMSAEIGLSKWTPDSRNDSALWTLLQRLISSLVYHPSQSERQSTLATLETLLSSLEAQSRFGVVSALVEHCPFVQVSAMMLRRLKDELDRAYDEPADGPFVGPHIRALVERVLDVRKIASSNEFVRRMNLISSALNFYRFVAIRDVQNRTGIHESMKCFAEDIAAPLREHMTLAVSEAQKDSNDDAKEEEEEKEQAEKHRQHLQLHVKILQGVLERTCEICHNHHHCL